MNTPVDELFDAAVCLLSWLYNRETDIKKLDRIKEFLDRIEQEGHIG